ncbi:MAG: hypothetical protein RBT75_02915 [Anaerolineae bacterium]|nr:hypothetical protein [Anaerolineae bacterium]
MKTALRLALLMANLGLLLTAALYLAGQPVQSAPLTPSAGGQLAMDTYTETVLTLNLSNQAPGRLINSLISQGHGDDTLFEVLGYLKDQSGGGIPDAFYQDVAGAPVGRDVFTAHLSDYAGLEGSLEIGADGSIHIRSLRGSTYAGKPGYETTPSQDGRFTLTYAQAAENYIYTGSDFSHLPGGDMRFDYYAFAIAWDEGHTVFLPLALRNAIPCFTDDFSRPESGWYEGAGEGWRVRYLNGEYQIQLTAADTWAWGSPLHPLPEDYRLEGDAHLTTSVPGGYGVLLSGNETMQTGYAFIVFPTEQAYVIVRRNSDGTQTTLEDEDFTSVIHAGTAVNRLRVDRIGASLHAYVNGVLVATWEDATYMGAGLHFGLIAYSYSASAVDARFDNFSACQTALSNPLFVEDFGVTGRWYEADHGWGQFSYQDGEYEILIRNVNSWGFADVPLEGGLPRFAVEVDARVSTGAAGIYGINFGQVDGDNLYHFRVYPGAQQYKLLKLVNGAWVDLTAWAVNPAINDETGTNRLRVERDGAQIRLYANGTLLTSLSDSSYLGNQELSLFGMSWTETPVAVRFDNFTLSELP